MKLFSDIHSYTYANGLKLYVLPRPGSTSLELQCAVRTGSIHEGENLGCGLSHFLEHMLFQGCRDFPGRSGTEKIERCGGSINAYTSYDRTVYYLRIPAQQKDLGVKLLASMVRFPELPEKRFLEEKDVILRECDLYFDSPATRLFLAGFEAFFGPHPARVPIIGCRDMISRVTRDMAADYHKLRYTPGRCFFVAVGAADPDQLYQEIGELLGDWPQSSLQEPALPSIPVSPVPRTIETVFPDTVSQLGLFLPVLTPGETIPAEVLCGILAGSSGSRLVRLLECEKEVALSADADLENFSGFSVPLITASSTPGKFARLESALRKELENIAVHGVTADELRREKNQRFADQLRQMCVPSHIASAIVDGVILNSDPAYTAGAMETLKNLSLENINSFAAKCLDSGKFLMVRQRPEHDSGKNVSRTTAVKGEKALLSSGVQLVTCRDNAVELVSFTMLLPGGAITEKDDERGLSHCIANTLLTGCGNKNEAKLTAALDRCGMDVSFSTGLNSFAAKMNAPRKYFSDAFKLMTEILAQPSFPEAAFEREKKRQLEKFRRRRMKPGKAAFIAGCEAPFGSHPYGSGEKGTPECVKDFSPEQAACFWNSMFRTGHSIIGFAGDTDPETAAARGEFLSSNLPWNGKTLELPDLPQFPSESRLIELPIPREQTVICRLLPVPVLRGQNGDMFHMLNLIENGMNSPLFRKIREDNSLAYSVGAKVAGGFHPGVFAFSAASQSSRISDVERCFDEEILRLGTTGVTEEEFNTAKDAMLFRLARTAESSHSLLELTLLDMYYGEDVNALSNAMSRIKNYTLDEFNAVIKKSFSAPVTVAVHAGKL